MLPISGGFSKMGAKAEMLEKEDEIQ